MENVALKEDSQKKKVIIVSAPAKVDPAAVLFAEGLDVNEADDLFSVETSGNAGLQYLSGSD